MTAKDGLHETGKQAIFRSNDAESIGINQASPCPSRRLPYREILIVVVNNLLRMRQKLARLPARFSAEVRTSCGNARRGSRPEVITEGRYRSPGQSRSWIVALSSISRTRPGFQEHSAPRGSSAIPQPNVFEAVFYRHLRFRRVHEQPIRGSIAGTSGAASFSNWTFAIRSGR